MNSCQFCSIDLNCDGVTDLLVFDRHGNRKITYLSAGGEYVPAPQYAAALPDLHDWVLTEDYNCDGKMDLFTYSFGGARVFKNVSDTVLKFKLETDLLKSYYYTGYVGILLTTVECPAIADIDGDGDLDLLCFFGLGSYVEYHKNYSMEDFGNCDSLDYRLTDHCWGNFRESTGSNAITLNVACPYKYYDSLTCAGPLDGNDSKHSGSTMLSINLNGDSLMDLVIGDVDFPNLIALTNGGTRDSASMISQDTSFPAGAKPVTLFSFPSASWVDADHDGLRDLVASPFDPKLFIAENNHSAWLYRNTGTGNSPAFEYQTGAWLQQDMLDFGSCSTPVLFDLNGDGLPDLLSGGYGYYDSSWYQDLILHSAYTAKIAYLKNTGNSFRMVTEDLGQLSALNLQALYPAFGDLNGDGFPDMITGDSSGVLTWFQNSGQQADPPVFLPPVRKYMGIDVGNFSAPQLFDLDRDGLLDLVIGEQRGNLNYYRNTGSATNPVFIFVTDSLGKVSVMDPNVSYDGYSTPCFFRDSQQQTRLMVGSEQGKLYYYTNIDDNLDGKFTRSDSIFETAGIPSVQPAIGWRTSPAVAHVTDQALMDFITGNLSGGLNYFSAHTSPQVITGIGEIGPGSGPGFSVYPNPANDRITIKSDGPERNTEYSVEVFTTTGALVLRSTVRDLRVVPVSDWTDGIYIIRISGSRASTSFRKVVIIH
jgi:hypothetical protein